MATDAAGRKCETCYGEGQVPTDSGPLPCPDCGGAGHLPPSDTLVEWRMREIERLHGERDDETARDVEWLVFELRRARATLTELLSLTDDLDDTPARARMLFLIRRALGL